MSPATRRSARSLGAAAAILSALIAVSASTALAGQTVYNSTGQAILAEALFQTEGGGGYAVAFQQQGEPAFMEVLVSSYQEVTCDAGTPDDPSDDYPGAQGHFTYGFGPASLAVTKSYGEAHATAILDLDVGSFNDCTWSWESIVIENVPVALDLVANGPAVMSDSSGSFHIPSELNARGSFRSVFRPAAGSVEIGGEVLSADYGQIGRVSWREHANQ